MKTIGLTRRIDELGRIVIPKEIRKNMHLKPGELLEIYINDSEILTMKKHEVLNKRDNIIKTLVDLLAKELNANVYLTNDEIIVFSNDKGKINTKISNNFTNIYNISPNGDKVGSLVIQTDKDIDKELINFAVLLLESYYEAN